MARGNRASVLTTGRLGAATGVSPDTIRHYESLGLLPKPLRTSAGYRVYPADCVTRVVIIRSALKAGFSLRELAGIFKERDGGGAPCTRVAVMAAGKLAELERKILDLAELRDWLSGTVDRWRKQLQHTTPGQPARLLESFTHVPGASSERKYQ
jgi:DNA-binding transcriptional MerR regulator